jgi:16S rRNA (cytosine967-C5)-methyltransferase
MPISKSASTSFTLRRAAHDPRAAALSAISRVLAGEADAQAALDAVLRSPDMVPSDKGLCTELVYGQLRAQQRLEWFSGRFLRKAEKLPWEMRLCIDQALYSLAFLRIPHRAAVHWAVEHVRNRFGQGLGKVTNGALRSMQRELAAFGDRAFYERECGSGEEALACWYSMPLWIVRLWQSAYGEDKALALLEASAAGPPQGLRLNRDRANWQTLRDTLLREHPRDATPVGPAGVIISHSLKNYAGQLIAAGRASGQSGASYAALEHFRPSEWPQPIWDCCAGRGGKTLALLEQGIAVALASDPSAHRLRALPGEYARLGLTTPPCPAVLVGSATDDPRSFTPLPGESPESNAGAAPEGASERSDSALPTCFGTIVVDAPCSGLGTLGRRPEIRYRRSEADCAQLAQTQRSILDAAWERLLPGGRLIYITCTANPAENEDQTAAFLARHPDAAPAGSYDGELALTREFFYGAGFIKNLGS